MPCSSASRAGPNERAPRQGSGAVSREAVIFALGPRRGGNSDAAARAFAEGVRAAGGQARVVALRDAPLLPCQGCHGCRAELGGSCVLPDAAQAEALFAPLLAAPLLALAAPIYFYHLPAQAKAFIDRSQPWYERREAREAAMLALPPRLAVPLLVAGRPRGERLFEGTLLTLKYFLKPFNVSLGEAVELRGYDGPGDLAQDEAALLRLRVAGETAWREAVQAGRG